MLDSNVWGEAITWARAHIIQHLPQLWNSTKVSELMVIYIRQNFDIVFLGFFFLKIQPYEYLTKNYTSIL